jgi:hypothetical protein
MLVARSIRPVRMFNIKTRWLAVMGVIGNSCLNQPPLPGIIVTAFGS